MRPSPDAGQYGPQAEPDVLGMTSLRAGTAVYFTEMTLALPHC
jgi:hypothetical protein